MRRCAPFRRGAFGPPFRRGFTLLEMCLVLFIIALLAGAMMPAMQSAFVEQAMRKDAHQLSLMVKTAMLQSGEQHRAYVIDLTETTMALHPLAETPADDDAASTNGDEADAGPDSVDVSSNLDGPNKLLVPDPEKKDVWVAMPPTEWLFQPGELCPASRVRLSRGNAWLEMSFNALTGNVEDEAAYLP